MLFKTVISEFPICGYRKFTVQPANSATLPLGFATLNRDMPSLRAGPEIFMPISFNILKCRSLWTGSISPRPSRNFSTLKPMDARLKASLAAIPRNLLLWPDILRPFLPSYMASVILIPRGQSVLQAPQSIQLKILSSSISDGPSSPSRNFLSRTTRPRALIPSVTSSPYVGHKALQLPHRTHCSSDKTLFIKLPAPETLKVNAYILKAQLFKLLNNKLPHLFIKKPGQFRSVNLNLRHIIIAPHS